jgi:hypothetical protein
MTYYTKLLLFAIIISLFSCKAYMHGYTWEKSKDSYQAVTGNKDNFGDKRLMYNKGFHKHSALQIFLTVNAITGDCLILFTNTNQKRNAGVSNYIT